MAGNKVDTALHPTLVLPRVERGELGDRYSIDERAVAAVQVLNLIRAAVLQNEAMLSGNSGVHD